MKLQSAPLGELAEFINGAAFKPTDWEDDGARIIRIQNLTDPSKPFNRTKRSVADKLRVQPGDLLVSWSATLGVFEWAGPDEGLLNQHIFRVLPDGSRVRKAYLRHMLHGALDDMERHLHGATMKHVNRGEFLDTRIPLPALEEQRRIAAILDQADALLAMRREALANLDDLTRSIFLDMFGDPSTDMPDWGVSTVGALADVQGGLQFSSGRKVNPIEVPYMRVANVHRERLDLTEIKTLRATEREINRTRLQAGDLLVVEGHGNPDEIGRGALWDGSIAECVHQNHLIRARFNRQFILPVYASAFINSPWGRRHLLRAGKTTSGLNTISVSDVRSTPIATPPMHLQESFVERLEGIKSLRISEERGLAQGLAFFASLQSRAFAGSL